MEYGIKAVIRIPNNEINYNLAGVVDFIEGYIESNPQSALMD